MAMNPASTKTDLNNPTQRANELNDPQFENQQGYFPYDLTHQEFVTPRFGEVTPTMFLNTVPGDRIVCKDNSKTILNQINGNFLSTINEYADTFYVPMRSLFPNNYERLIPNPTKGDDLPLSALPQFPIKAFINSYLNDELSYNIIYSDGILSDSVTEYMNSPTTQIIDIGLEPAQQFAFGRLLLLSTMLSRGQLLDYLGFCFELENLDGTSTLQKFIDRYQSTLYNYLSESDSFVIQAIEVNPLLSGIKFTHSSKNYSIKSLSDYRDAISSIFESGKFPLFVVSETQHQYSEALYDSYYALKTLLEDVVSSHTFVPVYSFDNLASPFVNSNYINIDKCLAYQQIIAQYYSNNTVDNIFNSDLYMQLLRSVMFPSTNRISSEPTFDYNGVSIEYDLISYGASYFAFTDYSQSDLPSYINRQYLFITLMFLMRRSLRYGDYFSTARPNMLAVGDLSIPVDSDSKVSPIDVTKNLLMQRYLNAANYIGSGFLPYFASIYGVTPSDTGTFPRFIAHRKVELTNNITENTSDNQGYQTTNLVGYTDDVGFDVFIDDIGIILTLKSYDVLPVYKSGIDRSYRLADRFDYFNPMLQGIGDQPILVSELTGDIVNSDLVFGYTMRNAEYKFKSSRAHGAFVRSLPGFLLPFPLDKFAYNDPRDLHIDPDFIRDKPVYLDSVVPQMTGISPAEYFHFVCAVTNQLQCARKIQATPPVLF